MLTLFITSEAANTIVMEQKNGSIKAPGKRIEVPHTEPNEEQRILLPGSKELHRCSSLGLTDKEVPVEALIERLAEIIIDAYIYEKQQRIPTNK